MVRRGELRAPGDAAGPGPRKLEASITGQVVTAGGQPVGSVTYRDDGEAPDRRAGDGVYAATFTVPDDFVPDLAASFGVRVAAVTAGGSTVGTSGGFLYSNPHARLTDQPFGEAGLLRAAERLERAAD